MLFTLLPGQALAAIDTEETTSVDAVLWEDVLTAGLRVARLANTAFVPAAPLQGASPPAAIRDIFPDKGLANSVRSYLRSAGMTDITVHCIVTQADLNRVQWFSLGDSSSVANLEGLQYLRNLSGFHAFGHEIGDLSPLSGLVHLENLILTHNQVSDLGSLSELINLRWLHLAHNQVRDLSPLSGLVSLEFLTLNNNQISDPSPLSALVNLGLLTLGSNQLNGNIAPLVELVNLSSLCLRNTQISDLTLLSGLVNLRTLSLDRNQISDLRPLSGLTNLSLLTLSHNQITDFSPIPPNVPPDGEELLSLGMHWYEQEVTLEPILLTGTGIVSIANMVRDYRGELIPPSSISDGGVYENGVITWSGLTTQQSVSFSWERCYGIVWILERNEISGTITIPLLDPATARTVIFQRDGIDTPITVFPNFPINWSQSATTQDIYNTSHEFATGHGPPREPGTTIGRAFWGWFQPHEFVRVWESCNTARPALGATGADLSTLTFTESELDAGITMVAVWSHWGDVNDDGVVDASDVLLLNQHLIDDWLSALGEPGPFVHLPRNLHAADVNADGDITGNDVLLFNRWLFDRFLMPLYPEPLFFGVVLGMPTP